MEVDGNTKPSTPTKPFHKWFLTINNWGPLDDNTLWKEDTYQYVMAQYEVGEEGTPHIHACLYYKRGKSFEQMKKQYPTAHLEIVGHWDKCVKYCSKEDTRVDGPYEWGEPPAQGSRTDLSELADAVREGLTNRELAELNPLWVLKYLKNIENLRSVYFCPRSPDSPPTVFWFWGASGTGKSKAAWSFDNRKKFMKDNTKWWCGYSQQPIVVIDDYDRWGDISFRQLLKITDRYPMAVEVKGGSIQLNSEVIIITCEHHPSEYWSGNELKQITRRMYEIKEFK